MKMPIQYALLYPERPFAPHQRIDFAALKQMTFFSPDLERFPCLSLALRALASGGTAPAVLNAANEVAVELFLADRIPFPAIASTIRDALDAHTGHEHATLDDLVRIDRQTREAVLRQFVTTV
jgi:1-deoxy-D-xylulose-5-phosphate reductoisomerase